LPQQQMTARWLAVACSVGSALLASCAPPAGPPDNLLIVVVDTLRADALGAWGSRAGASPHIDALTAESTSYEKAWAQGTYTQSSFLSYMTSTWVRTHGWDFAGVNYPKPGVCGWTDLVTLAEVLSNHGFSRTAFVANASLHPRYGFPRGFERWNGQDLASASRARLPDGVIDMPDAEVAERGSAEIGRWRRGERHLLYLHFMAPHFPLVPSPEARARFELAEQPAAEPGTPEHVELMRKLYLASVWDADREVGRVLAALDASGLRDTTLVVFFSDHGELLGEHGAFGHRRGVWEELAHVPLAIRIPGRAPARVDDRVAGLIDLPPTLLDLLGIPDRPASWQGEDLVAATRRAALFSERFREVAITSDGSTKAIFSPGRREGPWRFFELDSDAGEASPAPVPAVPSALQREQQRWARRTPRRQRDRDAEPVGFCGVRQPEEEQALRDALRALGYLR